MASIQTIPEALIYEMIDGKPIYYKGYRDILKGKKTTMSSYFQGFFVLELATILKIQLGDLYKIGTNEFGLQMAEKTWRKADIAVFKRDTVSHIPKLSNKYTPIAPELVVEVDTKGESPNTQLYINDKTESLLDFGVKKVVWILSDSKKVTIAEPHKEWRTFNWDTDFDILNGLVINVEKIVRNM